PGVALRARMKKLKAQSSKLKTIPRLQAPMRPSWGYGVPGQAKRDPALAQANTPRARSQSAVVASLCRRTPHGVTRWLVVWSLVAWSFLGALSFEIETSAARAAEALSHRDGRGENSRMEHF